MQKAGNLGLQYFIKRAQVLKAYRTLLRATKSTENEDLRLDVRSQITNEFRRNKTLLDPVAIKGSILEAQRSIEKVKEICAAPKAAEPVSEEKSTRRNSKASQSWISTDDQDDKRGRIGSGWPWES